MKVTLIAGARPNFIKIASIIDAIRLSQNKDLISYRLIHTGQHYDTNMSGSFFEELNIPAPDHNLNCGGGTQAEQTANIMVKFEKELIKNPTDLVMVVGDVTSTMACSIVAKKMDTDVAHVEAGIRSGDMTMPEEINRIVTDSISDVFFTTSREANDNLMKSGVPPEKIYFVGNTMIDTLLKSISFLKKPTFWNEQNLQKGKYLVATLHRPSNVDSADNLKKLLDTIIINSQGTPIIFPVHPRTKKTLEFINISAPNIHFVPPMSYLEFMYLVQNSKVVITDSGGITEETTVLGIPCITLRNSTERPETVLIGTNELIGTAPSAIPYYLDKVLNGTWKKGDIPELWDGKTGTRIIDILIQLYNS